jgi:ribose transport system substrate-binding protein
MMNRFHLLSLFLLLSTATAGCGVDTSKKPGVPKQYVIAVVPKATIHEFWKSIHAGAIQGAKESGVKILWKGPLLESDPESQINVVQDFITKRVDGICLAPLDPHALTGVVRDAKAEGIPVVLFGSQLDAAETVVSQVGTDNAHGGAVGARHLGQLLGGKGNVIMLRYTAGSVDSDQRENGFLDTLHKEFPDIRVLSDSEYAGASAEMALDKSQQLLEKYGDRVNGIFTPCQHVTLGMLRALEERGLAGKVKASIPPLGSWWPCAKENCTGWCFRIRCGWPPSPSRPWRPT